MAGQITDNAPIIEKDEAFYADQIKTLEDMTDVELCDTYKELFNTELAIEKLL